MHGLPSRHRWATGRKTFTFLYWYLADFLFPPRCVQCHSIGRSICGQCLPLVEWIGPSACSVCGQPLGKSTRHTCIDRRLLQWVRSAAVFSGPMRRAIHALKYSYDRSLASFLVGLSFPHFSPAAEDFDCILPVPLGKLRERKRGYNQSELLAEAISLKTDIPCDFKSLIRSRETISQVGLTHEERKQNVNRAFSAAPVGGCRVLLVDDVCTTGATLQSCAASLLEAGAQSVAGWTLARAILPGLDLHS